jgi:signal transduction histidine kinase
VSEATDRVHTDVAGVPVVSTDRERLHEILLNLVENALKYSPDGSPVEVDAKPAGDELVLRVRDRGIGIEPEDRAAIFERFRQVDQSATRAFGGLGLGLHLTRELCADLGGSIRVESTPGWGSTFTVRIPGGDAVTADGEEASLAERSGSGG